MLRFKAVLLAVMLLSAIAFSGANAGVVPTEQCTIQPFSMVSWWDGEGDANDIVGTNHGTLMNSATFAIGKVGQAFSLNGSSDYVQLTDIDTLKPTTAITVDAWIKLTYSPAGHVMIFDHESANPWYGYGMAIAPGNKLSVDIFSSGLSKNIQGSTSLQVGTWNHVAMTYDGAFIKVYINGVEDGSLANTGLINYTQTVNPTIGSRSIGTGNYFPGLIDEVEIFNRALSADEIGAIFSAGSAGKCRSCVTPPLNMVSWWGGDNNALDVEGNNNGTMMSGDSYASGMVGEAFSFNGTTQYFEAPDSTTLRVPTAVTLDAWVNTADSSASQMIVCKAQNIWNWSSYCLQIGSGGNLYFEIDKWSAGHYGVWRSDSTLTSNTWYHVAATWQNVYGDVRDAKIYINGVEQAAQLAFNQGYDSTFTLEYTSLPLFIGRDYVGNYYFSGLVDEVEIFDRVLSSSEIAAIYNAGSAGKCRACITPPSNLASWWGGDNNTIDLVGGYNGALYGGAGYGAGKVGQAFKFDGTDDHVFASNTSNIDGGTQATYDAWVYPQAAPSTSYYFSLFGAGDATQASWTANQCRVLYFSTQGSPENTAKFYMDCALNDNETTVNRTTAHDYPINSWHFVAGVFHDGSLDLYVNGILDNGTTTGPVSGAFINLNAYNYVWMGGMARYDQSVVAAHFNGLIDEVEIFNRALTANEIGAIYSAGSAGKCKEPDLIMTQADGPLIGTRGGTIPINFTVKNRGNLSTAIGTGISFYLSTDTTITSGDFFLGSAVVNVLLPPGTSVKKRKLGLINTKTPVGNYYIGAIVDPQNKISESNEGNNTGYDTGQITIKSSSW